MKFSRRISKAITKKRAIERCGFPTCRAACCVYGTWVSAPMVEKILENHEIIAPHLPKRSQNPELWFSDETEEDEFVPGGWVRSTNTIIDDKHYGGTACIFMREDYKCVLQVASEKSNFHPWHFKPFYCILHPLELNDAGEITLDRTEYLVIEPASCLTSAESEIPLQELFAEEIEYLTKRKK